MHRDRFARDWKLIKSFLHPILQTSHTITQIQFNSTTKQLEACLHELFRIYSTSMSGSVNTTSSLPVACKAPDLWLLNCHNGTPGLLPTALPLNWAWRGLLQVACKIFAWGFSGWAILYKVGFHCPEPILAANLGLFCDLYNVGFPYISGH